MRRTRRQGKRTFKATFRRIRQKNKLIRVRMKARRRAITAQRKLIDRVRAMVAKAKVKTLAQAANLVRRAARSLVRYRKNRKVAAAAGQPPFTHSQMLKKAILYAVSGTRAVIGPSRRIVGIVGGVHERGGTYKGNKYAPRPFMGPAMAEAAEKIPKVWRRNLRA